MKSFPPKLWAASTKYEDRAASAKQEAGLTVATLIPQ